MWANLETIRILLVVLSAVWYITLNIRNSGAMVPRRSCKNREKKKHTFAFNGLMTSNRPTNQIIPCMNLWSIVLIFPADVFDACQNVITPVVPILICPMWNKVITMFFFFIFISFVYIYFNSIYLFYYYYFSVLEFVFVYVK